MSVSPTTVAFHTLGCKLNFSETATLGRMLKADGFETVPFSGAADLYVINTCSVTENADRKCRAFVRQALKRAPEAFVVIVGCYAQLKPAEIADIEGVDLVLGAAEKFRLAEILQELKQAGKLSPAKSGKLEQSEYRCGEISEVHDFTASWSSDERTRAFLKVQDGCDYSCSFCTIPLARGKSRSAPIAEVIESAAAIAATGAREIVLTGINLGDYGLLPTAEQQREQASKTSKRAYGFVDLVKRLDEAAKAVERFRISSIEPNLLSQEIIDFVAQSERFMPHFHIPLQSGNDEILAKMRRRYRKDLYIDRVEQIKKAMPHACIGVDVITGFPGESEQHFLETYRFLQELPISYLHVFPYSERDNTLAQNMPDPVYQHERMERSKQLRILSDKKKRAFYSSFEGSERVVLMESEVRDGYRFGFTDNYLKVQLPAAATEENQMVLAKLGPVSPEGLVMAQVISQASSPASSLASSMTDTSASSEVNSGNQISKAANAIFS